MVQNFVWTSDYQLRYWWQCEKTGQTKRRSIVVYFSTLHSRHLFFYDLAHGLSATHNVQTSRDTM